MRRLATLLAVTLLAQVREERWASGAKPGASTRNRAQRQLHALRAGVKKVKFTL